MIFDPIPEHTVEEYKAALEEIKLTPNQVKMLDVQYNAPERTLTASELAQEFNYSTHDPVNLQYGKIGSSVAESLNIKVTKQKDGIWHFWRVICDECEPDQRGYLWKMKPNFAKALEQLGIVDQQ